MTTCLDPGRAKSLRAAQPIEAELPVVLELTLIFPLERRDFSVLAAGNRSGAQTGDPDQLCVSSS